MLKRFKTYFVILIILLAGIIGFFIWFFVGNDAPAIHGKIIWQQVYKENLKLDVYLPTHSVYEKIPVVLFIHGGAWIGGSKESVNFNRFNGAFNQLREQGYAIVSPAYTLANRNHSPFPDCIQDAFDALRWIEENVNTYNFDLQQVGVMGESAGAHLAMMLAYSDPTVFDIKAVQQIKLNYVVDVYGPVDLEKLYHLPLMDSMKKYLDRLPKHIEERFDLPRYLFGFDPEADTARRLAYAKRYSPVTYLNKTAPPTLIIQGKSDEIVPIEQTRVLIGLLDSLLIEHEVHLLEGVNHGFIGANTQQKDSIQLWIVDFVKGNYHSDQ